MRKKRIIKIFSTVFLSFYFISSLSVTASSIEELLFKNISIEDGLSQATVETIVQDKKGYMWFGTNDGLSRYNGYEFKVFRKEKGVENSICNNYIIDLKEDTKGNIWVGTINGVSKISPNGETISNYTDSEDKGNLSNYNIGDVLITKDGKVVIGTSDGIDVYNEKYDSFSPFITSGTLRGKMVYSLSEDLHGNIWVGTNEGISKVTSYGKVEEDFFFEKGHSNLETERVYKVFADINEVVWIGTFSNGITKLDLQNNKVTNYYYNSGESSPITSNYIKNFMRDSNGVLWASTEEGLLKYNDSKDSFTVYNHRIYDKNSLIDDDTHVTFQDKGGLIWVGTYSGISVFDPNNNIKRYSKDPFKENTLSDNMIQGIYQDDDGLLWVGTNSKGLNVIDRENDTVYRFNTANGLSSNSVNSIKGNGKYIYVGTHNGLNIINKEDNSITKINESEGLVYKIIKNLLVDSKGRLWIGTVRGFNIYNPEDGSITDITPYLVEAGVPDIYSGAIFEDKDGVFWLGTFLNGGLIKFDPNNKTIKNYLVDEDDENSISDNTIRSITEDSRGNLWIGTRLGLNKFNKETEEFTSYTTLYGLPNNMIYSVLLDDNENIWMSTNSGISNYIVDENRFINLDVTDGLQSNEFNGEAYFRGKDGEFFYGGINGLNSFYPKDLINSNYKPDLVFDEFKINGVDILDIDKEVFKSTENNINIQMFIPDYRNNKGLSYFYRINSSNNDKWYLMESNEIFLTNLSSGIYNIEFVGRNGNGVYTDIKSVTFKINPNPFLSNTAFICYGLIVIIIILGEKNKNKKLDEEVFFRTIELNDQMEMNKQLFQKILDLERYKNNYFVNVSHELRTPLNVLSSTQQLITTLNETEEGIEKEKLQHYMLVVKRNIGRLLKIINDLIDTSKIEGGKYILNINKVEIVSLVENAALSLRDYSERQGIELIVDPLIEELHILCDENEIERCIVNIVSNAIKFTPENGQILVTILEENQCVRIEIKDSGIGIAPEHHDSIFDRFSQVVDQKAEVKGGSGLGLTITKKIIDLHNGTISVKSEEGKGTTFIIILPIK